MREIKFRAWDKKSKKMRIVESIGFGAISIHKDHYPVINMLGYDTINQESILVHRDSPDFVLEQFTGLRDRNGKEIYEGDIIEYGAPEKLKNGNYNLNKSIKKRVLVEWKDFVSCGFNVMGCPQQIYEVIGNIHENPGLLEQT